MDVSSKRRPGELVFAVLLLVFAVTAFWQSFLISGFSGKTTPGVFPMLAAGTMILAATVILWEALRQAPPPPPVAARFLAEVLPQRHLLLIGLVLLYLVTMPYLGFLISSGSFLLLAFQLLWRKPIWLTLGLTGLTLTLIYLIFRQVFQVVLPEGLWLRGVL